MFRKLIKNYDNPSDPKVRVQVGRLAATSVNVEVWQARISAVRSVISFCALLSEKMR